MASGQGVSGSIASVVLQILAGVLFAVLAAGGVIAFVAWLDGTPLTDIPHWVVGLTLGAAAALPLLISLLYLFGWAAKRRRAGRLGIKAAEGACSYEQSLRLTWDPAVAEARCLSALRSLPQGCKVERIDAGQIVAKTGATNRSHGEILRVTIEAMPRGGCTVGVHSRPSVTQFFDSGINADNVVRVIHHLRYGTLEASADQPLETISSDDGPLSAWDWWALAVLLAVGAYTGFLILSLHRWRASFDHWASLLEDLPLGPTQWLGLHCMIGESALGHLVIQQLDILILPLILIYSLYHCAQFRAKRERMSGLDWILSIGSLAALPLVVAIGCDIGWGDDLTGRYRGLISFMLRESAGAVVYVIALVVFCNGISYLPALALARLYSARLPNPTS